MKSLTCVAKPDVCVFIGRFQPFHQGHARVIREGLARASRMVVLVGSANEPRSFRNPFTADERIAFIREAFPDESRLVVVPLEDSSYNLNEWLDRTRRTVDQVYHGVMRAGDPSLPLDPVVWLIGHSRDATSYYLDLFPTWGSHNVWDASPLSGTAIRCRLFGDLAMIQPELDAGLAGGVAYLSRYVDLARERAAAFLASQRPGEGGVELAAPVAAALERFLATPAYEAVAREYGFIIRYRHAWRHAPHPPSFLAADAVIIQSGHVLMVKRLGYPGKGLWALPGGFVEQGESIEDGCLREVAEETGIRLPPSVLRGRIQEREVFDAPFRSARGRTVSHAFLIHLKPGPLVKVRAGGQAGETARVSWVALDALRRDCCFEDHYAIINRMAARCRPVVG